MGMEDHPVFFGKDASNLPKQPTLFEILNEAQQLLRLTEAEIEQLEIDIRFLEIMMRLKNGQ